MGKKNTCAKRLAALATLRCADGLLLKAAPTARMISGKPVDVNPRHPEFEMWLKAVAVDPEDMLGVPADLMKDPDFVVEAVQRNPKVLVYAPAVKVDADMALAAVRENPLAFQYLANKIMDSPEYAKVALEAVKKNGLVLQFVKHSQMQPADYKEVALAAVRDLPMALDYVPKTSPWRNTKDYEEIEKAANDTSEEKRLPLERKHNSASAEEDVIGDYLTPRSHQRVVNERRWNWQAQELLQKARKKELSRVHEEFISSNDS